MKKWNQVLTLTVVLSSLFLGQQSFADDAAGGNNAPQTGLRLLDFRINEIAAFQSGGSSFSGEVSWNPFFRFNDTMGIRGNFGATLFNQSGGSNFVASEFALLFSYDLTPVWALELGGGYQLWSQTPSVGAGMGSFNIHYKLDKKFLFVIDRFFAGYSAVFMTSALASEAKLGVQIGF